MKIYLETERLILREITPDDKYGMFELDSDPQVHTYLGNHPISKLSDAESMIQEIRKQYIERGIGRLAVIEKGTNSFVGWSGLKLVKEVTNMHIDFYDIGYRFIKNYWGKGYATESVIASLKYGFEELKLATIYGMADVRNIASRNVLKKCGLSCKSKFILDGDEHDWLKITREEWQNKYQL